MFPSCRDSARFVALTVTIAHFAGCGAADNEAMFDEAPTFPGDSLDDAGVPGAEPEASPDVLSPEQELESSYEAPVATGRYVWVANPTSGQVAYVDAVTLQVRTAPAGHGPTFMAAIPGAQDAAIVINRLSNDATILRADAQGQITTSFVPVTAATNSWTVSPSGAYAIAWTNTQTHPNTDPLQGFQDVTVVRLSPDGDRSTHLSVGYRPVAVSFAHDETEAYAVTQDGVSVIDLTNEPRATRLVPLSSNPLEDPGSRDVSITPDGSLAFVRRDGQASISVVSLRTGDLTTVTLPGACTDLDLSSDGAHAVAAMREAGMVAVMSVPEIVEAPESFITLPVGNTVVGSVVVASEAPIALLYTNATTQERISVLDFGANEPQISTLRLHGPVLSAFASSDGSRALVIHQPMANARGAFSVMSLHPAMPAKIVATKAAVHALTFTPSGDSVVVTERDDSTDVFGCYLIRTDTQQVDRYALTSPPIGVGLVPVSNRAFVAQQHPEGRITFIDFETGLARTLTGFELGARVVDGSTP